MNEPMPHRLAAAVLVTMCLCSCVFYSTPDTPGNSAIHLTSAIRADDEQAGELTCTEITGVDGFVLADGATWGSLSGFYAATKRAWAEEMGAFSGDSEYSVEQEPNLSVDSAWTEIDFRGEEGTETWRLHMVREDHWRACGAERVN